MNGLTIKEIIRRKGLTQQEVAELLKMSTQNFSAALAKDDVKSSLIERVAEAIGVPVSSFYGDTHIHAQLGDHSSAVTGNNIQVNTITGEFLKELAAQRQITQKSQEQIDKLLAIIDKISDKKK